MMGYVDIGGLSWY